MSFSHEVLVEIKNRIDIIDYIGEFINLKTNSKGAIGCCPFHPDKNPSFSILKDRQIWKCFSENISGDIFKFYQKYHNVNFEEAVIQLAKIADVNLEMSDELKAQRERKELLLKINLHAMNFFKRQIKHNQEAQEYLKQRKLDTKIIESFNIGCSPIRVNSLFDELSKRYKTEDILACDLIKTYDGEIIEKFRNRIIFPILDHNNKVCGFTGRIYDDSSKAKYLNTSDTETFKKSEILYGFNLAKNKIKEYNTIVLVEGQIDCIRAHQYGLNNVVATSGTALSEAQALLISRHANNAILILDNDEAGQNAIHKMYEVILKVNPYANIKVADWNLIT